MVAKDDQTVVFTLTQPATYFVDMLTLPAFSPAPEEVLEVPAGQPGRSASTRSPTVPTRSSRGTRPRRSSSPATRPGTADSDPIRKAYVDKVVVNETVSQESVQQQLQTGNAERRHGVRDRSRRRRSCPGLIAAKDPNLNLGETDSTNPYIVFNTVSPNNGGALKNAEVRQALEYAMNRDNIIQVLGGPKINPPLTHVLPPGIVGSQDLDLYPYDVAKAKSLLADAGYSDGLTLKFLYRSASEGSTKAFQTVQQDLSDAGIKVEGVPSPDADFYTKYLQEPTAARSGVWDVSLAGWGPDWFGNAALSFFGPLFSGEPSFPPVGSNFGFYDNPATNELIDQAAAAPDESTAASLWAKADEQVMKDAPFFPITSPLNANYHATQVNNAIYLPAIQNFDPANVWLSPDMQGG